MECELYTGSSFSGPLDSVPEGRQKIAHPFKGGNPLQKAPKSRRDDRNARSGDATQEIPKVEPTLVARAARP